MLRRVERHAGAAVADATAIATPLRSRRTELETNEQFVLPICRHVERLLTFILLFFSYCAMRECYAARYLMLFTAVCCFDAAMLRFMLLMMPSYAATLQRHATTELRQRLITISLSLSHIIFFFFFFFSLDADMPPQRDYAIRFHITLIFLSLIVIF